MENFTTDLPSVDDDHFVVTTAFARIMGAMDEVFVGGENFQASLAAGPYSSVLLGSDKWNTPFILDGGNMTARDGYLNLVDQIATGCASARQREAVVNALSGRISDAGKSLYILVGYSGQDVAVDVEDPINMPENTAWANSVPSPFIGYPIYITLGGVELHVGTLFNVGDRHRMYTHHSNLFSSESGVAETKGSITRRANICYKIFAMALDKLAYVTGNIEDETLGPQLFMKLENRDSIPGTSGFVDVLTQRRLSIANDLKTAETNLIELQDRAMQAASSLISLRRINEDIRESEGGIISVSDIDHPMIDTIFVRNSRGQDTVYITSKEIFFKPSSNPNDVEYDEEQGVSCGKFLMQIAMYATQHPVKFINLDYRVIAYEGQPMNHPHVFKEGDPCLGSFGSSITSALADGNLESVIDMSFLFLAQANQDDSAGRFWSKWVEHLDDEELTAPVLENF